MLLDNDVVTDREAEPGAFPGGLGREEGIEHLVFYLGRNAGAVVANPDLHPVAEIFCRRSKGWLPFIRRFFADSGYAGEKVAKATLIAVEIVRKNPDQVGFAVNPRRWVVERFFAWIGRNRRLAKDFEATIDSARAFLYAASVMLLVRRIARAL
jgi:transposase